MVDELTRLRGVGDHETALGGLDEGLRGVGDHETALGGLDEGLRLAIDTDDREDERRCGTVTRPTLGSWS